MSQLEAIDFTSRGTRAHDKGTAGICMGFAACTTCVGERFTPPVFIERSPMLGNTYTVGSLCTEAN